MRFEKVNYAGITTNNYALDELVMVTAAPAKGAAKAKAPAAAPKAPEIMKPAASASPKEAPATVMKFEKVNLGPRINTSGNMQGQNIQSNYWDNTM